MVWQKIGVGSQTFEGMGAIFEGGHLQRNCLGRDDKKLLGVGCKKCWGWGCNNFWSWQHFLYEMTSHQIEILHSLIFVYFVEIRPLISIPFYRLSGRLFGICTIVDISMESTPC